MQLLNEEGPAAIVVKPARLYAAFWRWHFLAALIVIPFVLWQSTTGTLYLWSEWWMDVRHPELRFVPVSDAAVLPSRQMAAAFSAIGANSASAHAGAAHAGHEHHGPSATAGDHPVQQIVLQGYIDAVQDAEARRDRLTRQINELLPSWPMAPVALAL